MTRSNNKMRNPHGRQLLLALALLGLLPIQPAPVCADWVELRDGSRFYGTITDRSEHDVTLKSQGESFRFSLDQVLALEHDVPVQEAPPSRWQRWGQLQAQVPVSFASLGETETALGSTGQLLAHFEETSTGAQLSIARAKRPYDAPDFASAMRSVRKHLELNRSLEAVKWQRRTWHDSPALFAELAPREPGRAPVRYLQAWIELAPEAVYCLSIAVDEGAFLRSPEHYRGILKRLTPASETP